MNRILLTLFFFCSVFSAQAQQRNEAPMEDNAIYQDVDLRAGFEGGLENFFTFIMQNMYIRGLQNGETTLEFVVEKDGSVSNVTTVYGERKWFNKEIVRVVSLSPRWLPAYKGGKAVRMQFSMPLQLTDSHLTMALMHEQK